MSDTEQTDNKKKVKHTRLIIGVLVVLLIVILITLYAVFSNRYDNQGQAGDKYNLGAARTITLDGGDSVRIACRGRNVDSQRIGSKAVQVQCLGEKSDRDRSATINPTVTPSFSPAPSSGDGVSIPYGPFHFGENKAGDDYAHPLAGAFSGSFVNLSTDQGRADSLLPAARAHGQQLIVSITQTDPCYYWDGSDEQRLEDNLVADAKKLIPTVARYWPDTVIGVMLINEPHNPSRCTVLPVKPLYDAARQIRAEFAKNGVGDIYFGYNTQPVYIEDGLTAAESQDGTINLSFIQWHEGKGDIAAWAAPQKAAAARMSGGGHPHKIAYAVNTRAILDSDPDSGVATVIAANTWECQQKNDALMVWWYTWHDIAASDFRNVTTLNQQLAVRAACDGN